MLIRTINRVNNLAGDAAMWLSAGLLVYIVAHISLEIVLRSFFDSSTFSMDEFVGYAIATMTFLSLANTFRNRKHIRVSILQSVVKGRLAIAVELVCIAFTFAITAFLARYIWRTLARDFARGTVSPSMNETPVWLIDAAIFTGLAIFMLQLVTSMIQAAVDGVPEETFGGE